jgi:hypothetical protein
VPPSENIQRPFFGFVHRFPCEGNDGPDNREPKFNVQRSTMTSANATHAKGLCFLQLKFVELKPWAMA